MRTRAQVNACTVDSYKKTRQKPGAWRPKFLHERPGGAQGATQILLAFVLPWRHAGKHRVVSWITGPPPSGFGPAAANEKKKTLAQVAMLQCVEPLSRQLPPNNISADNKTSTYFLLFPFHQFMQYVEKTQCW